MTVMMYVEINPPSIYWQLKQKKKRVVFRQWKLTN